MEASQAHNHVYLAMNMPCPMKPSRNHRVHTCFSQHTV